MFSELKGKRVALIGGAGFIGHNMALKLKAAGAEPYVVDGLHINNLGFFLSHQELAPQRKLYSQLIHERLHALDEAGVPIEVIDARDYHALTAFFGRFQPDAIVHLAAVAHANRANKSPYTTFDHSMRTLENALDCARTHNAHFVFFSSSMVYGNFEGDSVTEDSPCNPLGIYAALKFGGEKIVIGYNQVFDLPYTIIRPSALYGERCVSRRVGQAFIENALTGKDLTINGDGTDRLDFTYIDDLITGVMLALAKPEGRNEIFNITFGGARSLNEMAGIVQEYFPNIKISYQPRSALMPERGTLEIGKARRLLGYNPASPLEIGFRRYIEWYKDLYTRKPEAFQ
jgi:nucleoside-diphosphate-sugar epimerase